MGLCHPWVSPLYTSRVVPSTEGGYWEYWGGLLGALGDNSVPTGTMFVAEGPWTLVAPGQRPTLVPPGEHPCPLVSPHVPLCPPLSSPQAHHCVLVPPCPCLSPLGVPFVFPHVPRCPLWVPTSLHAAPMSLCVSLCLPIPLHVPPIPLHASPDHPTCPTSQSRHPPSHST